MADTIKIVELTEDRYNHWEEFCASCDEAWFWHTIAWLKYCAAYRDSRFETRNLSFLAIDETGILAICPLFLEKREDPDGQVRMEIGPAGSGGLTIVPAIRNEQSEDRREKICQVIFKQIDQLALKYQAVRATFRMSPLNLRPNRFNWLLKHGCLDNSVNTQIIDLSSPVDRLWSALRKGHKYDVHRGEKHYQIDIYGQSNPDKNAFEQYRLLHHKAAGRITRPTKTFEMMYDWLRSGNGILCSARKNGRYAGFSYIILYKDGAYYGSASDDPDFETDIPISHVIQWKVIQWLRDNGYKKYEIGQQQFNAQFLDIPTVKDLNLSLFKRGFGGETIPSYRGTKYYDKNFMETDLANNLSKLIAYYRT